MGITKMPTKAGLKRTIKLRHANQQGKQFIKVGSNNKDSYPIFELFINLVNSVTLPTFVFSIPKVPGEASPSEILEQHKNFWTQEVTYASFMKFMFENTFFETFGAIPEQPTHTTNIFDFLLPDQEAHYIGAIDESGNLVP